MNCFLSCWSVYSDNKLQVVQGCCSVLTLLTLPCSQLLLNAALRCFPLWRLKRYTPGLFNNSLTSSFNLCALRVFREQEPPLWSSRKCRSGWEHESADEQSSVRLQEISEPLAETWWEIYWKPLSVQFSISIKSSPGAGFFPAGAEAHDKCFIITPTRGAGCS